jgi:hypothetical protein
MSLKGVPCGYLSVPSSRQLERLSLLRTLLSYIDAAVFDEGLLLLELLRQVIGTY